MVDPPRGPVHLDRCREALRAMFPVAPESLEQVRRTLEAVRGNRIRVAVTDPGGRHLPTGLWAVLGTDTDLVWADATLSPPHQMVTVCHEFGHMLCGHEPVVFGPDATVDGMARSSVAALADVPDERPTAALGRCGVPLSGYDEAARRMEDEAELVGRLLARPFLDDHQAELAALLVGRQPPVRGSSRTSGISRSVRRW